MNARLIRRRESRRRGFTLIEVLLVAGIIVMLAAIVVPSLMGSEEQAKIRTAKAQVLSYASMFDQYKATYEQDYPNGDGFSVLANGGPNIAGFRALIENPRPLDPWGQPYNYEFPTTKNKMGKPAVWSNGPDKQSGSGDDIGNWTTAR